ncbi:hypothetical protein PR048_025552 [Dryococelus australis]|uniref:COP9 signalosome complex subunit 7 helix I domain-containing protein n=1 Tax=Dryococelus australis TaxID=614101 RepID=A0ABQ9GRP9_9NEOP|nr:hypothetical protein PR048_025552 [Dryococelus australis]
MNVEKRQLDGCSSTTLLCADVLRRVTCTERPVGGSEAWLREVKLVAQYLMTCGQHTLLQVFEVVAATSHSVTFEQVLKKIALYYYHALHLFAYGTYRQYLDNMLELPQLTRGQKKKLQHLTIVTLATRTKCIPYCVLLQELDIKNVRDLEDLIIEAIYAAGLSYVQQFGTVEFVPNHVGLFHAWVSHYRCPCILPHATLISSQDLVKSSSKLPHSIQFTNLRNCVKQAIELAPMSNFPSGFSLHDAHITVSFDSLSSTRISQQLLLDAGLTMLAVCLHTLCLLTLGLTHDSGTTVQDTMTVLCCAVYYHCACLCSYTASLVWIWHKTAGKLDQKNSQLEVDYAIGRDIRVTDIGSIVSTLQEWCDSCEAVLSCVEDQIMRANSYKNRKLKHKEMLEQEVSLAACT